MTALNEKTMWEMVAISSPSNPNLINNPLSKRLCNILKIIIEISRDVGISEYEVTVKKIKNKLELINDIVDESAIYRYIRKAVSAGLLSISTKTIRSYKLISSIPILPGENPSIYIKDENGYPIPPSRIYDLSIYAESGEITLKNYKITDKGNEFLGFFTNERDE